MRLNRIHIKGFKDPERIVDLEFSKTPISVVYGENGCGKTTLLRVLHGIFKQDEEILKKENIQEVEIEFEAKGEVIFNKIIIGKENTNWGINAGKLSNSKSILFGIHRGIPENYKGGEFFTTKLTPSDSMLNKYELDQGNIKISNHDNHHLKKPFTTTTQLKRAIISQYNKGQDAISKKVKDAYFNTIANAVYDNKPYNLPDNFWSKFEQRKDFLKKAVEQSDPSQLRTLLDRLLKDENPRESPIPNSRILRALLVNMLDKAEEDNIELKSITKLMEMFNDHLYGDKKLVVNSEEAYIALPRGRRHELDDLSSGERHLLSFLTLFLIINRGRDFYLIDEPEISLSMKWQRELLPLLSELSPNSQIIAATHSPSIANRNTQYLVELV